MNKIQPEYIYLKLQAHLLISIHSLHTSIFKSFGILHYHNNGNCEFKEQQEMCV